jgi:hypothetical protein
MASWRLIRVASQEGEFMSRKTKLSAASSEPERLMTLSELCNDAAEHVAQARMALFVETADADIALAHLDQAIDCLKRLFANSKSSSLNGSRANLRLA